MLPGPPDRQRLNGARTSSGLPKSACEHAVALDLATHDEGTFTFLPLDEQPGSRKGLFD